MARTIEQIQNEILKAKETEASLNGLNSTSKVAIWRLWVYITAFVIWTLEKIFDEHKKEVSEALSEQKPHTARWYRNKALAFQYGFNLHSETNLFDNTGKGKEEIENSKIIKYSAVTEVETESRLIVKIATEQGGELQPISQGQKASFDAYINEIRDAGVCIATINYLPDILKLQMKIYRDPLVLNENGQSILSGEKPVEKAIKRVFQKIAIQWRIGLGSLGGCLATSRGCEDSAHHLAESKWIDTEANGYGNFQPIEVKTIPISGYFKIENFDNINYIV